METVTSKKAEAAPTEDTLTMDNIMSVYSGVDGRCYCGCAGDHYYNSKFVKAAGKDRGYVIQKDEVDDKQIARIIRIINNAKVVEAQDVCITTVVGKRAYTAYFTVAERERRASAATIAELLDALKAVRKEDPDGWMLLNDSVKEKVLTAIKNAQKGGNNGR